LPDVSHSAALIGWGSEVLGFDDDVSTDHNWGLRFQIFLSGETHAKHFDAINRILNEYLPSEFQGFPTDFEIRVNRDQRGEREDKHIKHNIDLETIEGFFTRYLGCHPNDELKAADWLTFPEHKLLVVTGGKVFYDGLGELENARRKFEFYPRDVWFYMLAAQWSKIFEEQAFVGRAGQSGDESGSALLAARQIEKLMRLCFLIERKYAPYGKWFGKAFSRLHCAVQLKPVFENVWRAKDWRERQKNLAEAYKIVIGLFNDLKITSQMSEEISEYFTRPFLVIKDESIVEKLRAAITDDRIKNIKHNLGSVNQMLDSSAPLNDTALAERLKVLYQ
jgi:hypothetical protein